MLALPDAAVDCPFLWFLEPFACTSMLSCCVVCFACNGMLFLSCFLSGLCLSHAFPFVFFLVGFACDSMLLFSLSSARLCMLQHAICTADGICKQELVYCSA